jgi:hypothetical protein
MNKVCLPITTRLTVDSCYFCLLYEYLPRSGRLLRKCGRLNRVYDVYMARGRVWRSIGCWHSFVSIRIRYCRSSYYLSIFSCSRARSALLWVSSSLHSPLMMKPLMDGSHYRDVFSRELVCDISAHWDYRLVLADLPPMVHQSPKFLPSRIQEEVGGFWDNRESQIASVVSRKNPKYFLAKKSLDFEGLLCGKSGRLH